jgi:hypothetical protein
MGQVIWKEVEQDGQLSIQEIYTVVVNRFKIGDVEDPDLYAAQPLYEWEKSEQGQFIMTNAIEKPIWQRQINYASYHYDYVIIAKLEKKKLSEFYLKWGNK